MNLIPICPHCGQPDEENIWLALQQDDEYDDTFDCERCGGAYRLRNRGGCTRWRRWRNEIHIPLLPAPRSLWMGLPSNTHTDTRERP